MTIDGMKLGHTNSRMERKPAERKNGSAGGQNGPLRFALPPNSGRSTRAFVAAAMANVSVHTFAPQLDSALLSQGHMTETQKFHAENANNSEGACAGSAPLRRQQALLGCSFDSVVLRPPCSGSSASPPGPLIPPDPCSLGGFATKLRADGGMGAGHLVQRGVLLSLRSARARVARAPARVLAGGEMYARPERGTPAILPGATPPSEGNRQGALLQVSCL
jgi:hypothetical protein